MNRSNIIIAIGFLFALSYSQDEGDSDITATGSLGSSTIEGKIYNQISFRPELRIKKLGIGLDLKIYIDQNGEVYPGNWDFSDTETSIKTLMDKIYYVRWGNKNDNFYFRVGSLEAVTLGYGGLVERYSNSMEYPQVKKLGLDLILTANLPGDRNIKSELVYSDFKSSPSLIGLQSKFNIAPRTNMYIVLAHDMNQLTRLDEIPSTTNEEDWMLTCQEISDHSPGVDCEVIWKSLQNEAASSETNPVSGVSVGFDYVISPKLSFYMEWVKLIGELSSNAADTGIDYTNDQGEPGVYSTNNFKLGNGFVFPGLQYNFRNGRLKVEGRHVLAENFVFNYWDRSYDLQRTVLKSSTTPAEYYTKEDQLYKYGKMSGLYAHFTYDILRIMNFLVGYQIMQGDVWSGEQNTLIKDENQSFSSSLNINPNLIPKVKKMEIFYQTNNVTDPFEITIGTVHGYDIGIEASDNMTITYQSRTTYRYNEYGELEPVKIMQLDTQFDF